MLEQLLFEILDYADIIILLGAASITAYLSWRDKIPERRYLAVVVTFLTLIGVGFLRLRVQLNSLSRSVEEVATNQETTFEHLKTSEGNWNRALDLLRPMGVGWRAYDTSTYPNATDYEQAIVAAIRAKAQFERLFCFSEGNTAMEEEFLAILSPQHDQTGARADIRAAIRNHQVIIHHYPVGLSADYLVVENKNSRNTLGAMIAFQTDDHRPKRDVYTWGISLENAEAASDLKELFENKLIDKARSHYRNEFVKDEEARCLCYQFYDRTHDALFPKGL